MAAADASGMLVPAERTLSPIRNGTFMTSQDQRLRGPARALLVIDQPVLADVVKLALNHNQYTTRMADTVEAASTLLDQWRPHLAVLDMDIAGGRILGPLNRENSKGGQAPQRV